MEEGWRVYPFTFFLSVFFNCIQLESGIGDNRPYITALGAFLTPCYNSVTTRIAISIIINQLILSRIFGLRNNIPIGFGLDFFWFCPHKGSK